MNRYSPAELAEIEEATRQAIDTRAPYSLELEMGLQTPSGDLVRFQRHIPGKNMLDVGCGSARYVDVFAAAGLNYVGIDLSPMMVEIARAQHPKMRFEVMSYRKLAFPDHSFDGLWCCCSLSHEPKINFPNVLQEFRRVLRPGGLLYIIIPNYGETGERQVYIEAAGAILTHVSLWDFEEIKSAIADAGLAIVEAHDNYQDWVFSIVAYA